MCGDHQNDGSMELKKQQAQIGVCLHQGSVCLHQTVDIDRLNKRRIRRSYKMCEFFPSCFLIKYLTM